SGSDERCRRILGAQARRRGAARDGRVSGHTRTKRSGREAVILAAELQRGLKEAFLAAAVVTHALVLKAIHLARLHEGGDSVGQLDLAADACLCLAQMFEDFWFKDVTTHHRQI